MTSASTSAFTPLPCLSSCPNTFDAKLVNGSVDEINHFLPMLPLLMVFHHSNSTQTDTVVKTLLLVALYQLCSAVLLRKQVPTYTHISIKEENTLSTSRYTFFVCRNVAMFYMFHYFYQCSFLPINCYTSMDLCIFHATGEKENHFPLSSHSLCLICNYIFTHRINM